MDDPEIMIDVTSVKYVIADFVKLTHVHVRMMMDHTGMLCVPGSRPLVNRNLSSSA